MIEYREQKNDTTGEQVKSLSSFHLTEFSGRTKNVMNKNSRGWVNVDANANAEVEVDVGVGVSVLWVARACTMSSH